MSEWCEEHLTYGTHDHGGGRESGADRKAKPSATETKAGRDEGPPGPPGPLSTGSAASPAVRQHRVVCVGHLCAEWHDVDPEALKAELVRLRKLVPLAETITEIMKDNIKKARETQDGRK